MEDDRAWLLDDLLIEADMKTEVNSASFWEGYREDGEPLPDDNELLADISMIELFESAA